MKEAGLARGLFWEPLLRSNGLVRATLTFLSGEEGRIGEGRGSGREIDSPAHPQGGGEGGPAGCRNSAWGAGTVTEGNFPSWGRTGDPSTYPFTVLLERITVFFL